MHSPAGPFKVAVEAALRGSAPLATAMSLPTPRIYTQIPDAAPGALPLPYVVIGEDQIIPEDTGCCVEAEITSTVHWWSKVAALDKGSQARAMGSAIATTLCAALPVTGWTVDVFGIESERYLTEADGSTHGILTFRHLVTEAGA